MYLCIFHISSFFSKKTGNYCSVPENIVLPKAFIQKNIYKKLVHFFSQKKYSQIK